MQSRAVCAGSLTCPSTMGDNKAPGVEETILREERARRGYYCGRFGTDVKDNDIDNPHWSAWDNDKMCAPLHANRTPYAYGIPNYGVTAFRSEKAARGEVREKTPAVPSAFKPPPFQWIQTEAEKNAGDGLPVWPQNQQYAKGMPGMDIPLPKTPRRGGKNKPQPPKSCPPRGLTGASQRSGTAGSADREGFEDVDGRLPTSGSVVPPSRGVSRHSASLGALPLASSHSRRKTGQSMRSHMSAASLRSQISEAVQKEIEKVERSELQAYYEAIESKKQRGRQAQLDMPLHLRTGTDPINTGCPRNYLTEQMRSLSGPIKMATDPKWSTDLKKINGKVGQRLEWERKISASLTGQIIPERKYMPPQDFVSNPPTPYFVPGQAGVVRARLQ